MPRLDRKKLLLLLLIFCVILLWVVMDWPCVLRRVTGIPCPGCGLSRAWLAVLRLDFVQAFRYHPMFWSIPVFGLYILFDGKLFRQEKWNRSVLAILVGGFILCYGLRLIAFFFG